ncbi:MAG: RluA family pseudouridine synthase [Actinomycetota bacterium]|nr:RluA family pseudouridine synthase [Actinomycetota bacterium]
MELRARPEDEGERLDAVLAGPLGSRARAQRLIEGGHVLVDGASVPKRHRVRAGELIAVHEPPEPPRVQGAHAPYAVPYEDDDLLVVDKPAGVVVHPARGHPTGTLAQALAGVAGGGEDAARAGIVHRLDKDTSGLLVVAKTDIAQTDLVRQLQAKTVHREYLALAAGDIVRGGAIDAPIGRHPVRRTSMAIVASGKAAVTRYEVRERFGDCTLLACRLETGRTHQIRVHLTSLGHPLVGDPTYGKRRGIAFGRQALHAWRLGLIHPSTKRPAQWESPLPSDFASLLATLRRRAGSDAR